MGKAVQSILKGFYTLLNSKRIWVFQYFMNFLFALLITFPLNSLMRKTVGNSLSVDRAYARFDYTLMNDFLQNYGLGVDTIKSQSMLVFFLYLLLLVFFNAGILHVVQRYPGSYKFREFLAGGVEYFWRFFRLFIYFLILYFVLLFIGFKIATINGLSPFGLESESGLIFRSKIVLFVLGFLFILLRMLQDIIKVMITKSREPIIMRSIVGGIGFFKKHFLHFFMLAILQLTVLAISFGFYIIFRNATDHSFKMFFLVFLLGQVFVLSRIALRIWRLSSVYQLVLRA